MNEDLKDYIKQLLDKKEISKYKLFSQKYIDKINKGLNKSRLFYMRQIWSLLNFQLWHKIFIENKKLN